MEMRQIVCLAGLGALLACPAWSDIINGSFETSDFTGWSVGAQSWYNEALVVPGGTDGDWHAFIHLWSNGNLHVAQNFDFTAGPYALAFDAWIEGDAHAVASVWEHTTAQSVVDFGPTPTTYVLDLSRYSNQTLAFAFEVSTDRDTDEGAGHLDNVRIVEIPEPGTLMMLSFGLVTCAVRIRRSVL